VSESVYLTEGDSADSERVRLPDRGDSADSERAPPDRRG